MARCTAKEGTYGPTLATGSKVNTNGTSKTGLVFTTTASTTTRKECGGRAICKESNDSLALLIDITTYRRIGPVRLPR